MIDIIKYPSKESFLDLVKRPTFDYSILTDTVSDIIQNVKDNGDSALFDYAKKFDNVSLSNLRVTEDELKASETEVSEELKGAIDLAASNIEKFHASQKNEIVKVETSPGVVCWQKSMPIEKVGLYIPGGTAPLFSTVLMLGVPASIAGCSEIVLCTPPSKTGKINPAILYTAYKIGIKKVFKVGGAQAIAAMAHGTTSIPKVDKVFGPGNQFVTCAKQLVSMQDVAIDMPAGPSEVLVIADDSCNPAFVAADMLSQAEHGKDSQAILLTRSKKVLETVQVELEKQLNMLPRKELAAEALKNSKIILLNDKDIMSFSNMYAPEHLIISTSNYNELMMQVTSAGSVFLGNYAPESAGDYASGTNHTLPTNGYARAYSGVTLDSYCKKVSFQEITKEGILNIGRAIEIMAEAEQLDAHKNAVTLRIEEAKK